MLTPAFELSQNDDFLIVSIQVPYAKISEVEVHFEDHDFMFFSKPYYLRLNLPGRVSYCETPTVKYDVEKRTVTIHAPKSEHGEVFEGLDLITKLLAPRKKRAPTSSMIEVIDGANISEDSDEEFDWNIEQVLPEMGSLSLLTSGQQCGFADSYSFAVFNLKEEASEIFDVKDPQNKYPNLRKQERLEVEYDQFNEDHYIADLYSDEEIQQLMKYRPQWEDLYDAVQTDQSASSDEKISFTAEEKERLRKLPNKEYLLDKAQVKTALLGLIDIIFAYAYNKRTTEGENTVESAWTINKLSATFSWLEKFTSVSEVAHTCIRRSLCYPLYRHFELSVTILEDVRKILSLGRKYVIKCLLEIHEMFCLSEPRYILNDIYVTDYCVWMQSKSCSTKKLAPMANSLGKVLLTKGDIGFNLVDIESFAAIAWMAEDNSMLKSNSKITEEYKTCTESGTSQVQPHNSTESNADILCLDLENLSLRPNSSTDLSEESYTNSMILNTYESCSSCTSDSDSSSNTFETDSTEESDSDATASSIDSDDDTGSSTDSDDACHNHLLAKESTGERLR